MDSRTAKYVIGVDFGTDSARALLVNAYTGEELASSVKNYPRWSEGKYCDPVKNQYRQHPLDYMEVLEGTVKEVLAADGRGIAGHVVGISMDTTGSTPVLTDAEGIPLALTAGFEENPNAMFILWKDHTAVKEAEEINRLAKSLEVDYTKYVGGVYSSEWVWAKVLHVIRQDTAVRRAAASWIEHCDWMPALLCGRQRPVDVVRSRCAAGHKALWHAEWNGLPPASFFSALDPDLGRLRQNLSDMTFTSDVKVGYLTPEWASRLGLTTKVAVGTGAFDCHMGAVGGEATPNVLTRTIGTSTCDIMTANPADVGDKLIAGICGQVDGSVIPGYVGLEAGQSGFGDIYAWFKKVIAWPVENLLENTSLINPEIREKLREEILEEIIPHLSEAASRIPVEESAIVALDWMNGRRTPDANQQVKGAIMGLTLASDAPRIFKALVEATAFGSKAIVERFEREGVRIHEIIGLGGVAKKSPYVMQTMANVLNMPIKVAATEQTCAFGAAMFAAVAGGLHQKVEDAQKAMGKGFDTIYYPDKASAETYQRLYQEYLRLGKFAEEASA
ncbi:MAG: ribulokinase [Bacteroidales bacterium]|nr:ribulokinase [Lentimicrobiaceae bacterium]MDD5694816.1 ribulokinase [Bacteroidales bacterium]